MHQISGDAFSKDWKNYNVEYKMENYGGQFFLKWWNVTSSQKKNLPYSINIVHVTKVF